ncbi:MAG TPA: MobF family relaxase [Nocardioides sp.]|nr:MobF family relaxase [Nocardioides sp.]
MKFYTGAAKAARAYLERDHSRADDYYLHEGTGLATRLTATATGVEVNGSMNGDTYEQWVAGIDLETGQPKGRLRTGPDGLRFLEVTVNGPKTWSLAAALHPEISDALDAAQDQAATQIVAWIAQHATTRVGTKNLRVQVPVEEIEAAVIRHYTSRAGDPHRHLHLQINARVQAAGGLWRGIHSIGLRDSIEAINGIGHAAVATNPHFRAVLAKYGYTIDAETSEIQQLAPFAGAFSARTKQIHRNIDRYEAEWRTDHPGQEPGPGQRRAWDRRAWAEARPDKIVPVDGADLVSRWNHELRELGYRDPQSGVELEPALAGWIDRDAAADFVLTQLAAKKSAWNGADIRGRVEVLLARTDLVTEPAARVELAEDVTARAIDRCERLLYAPDVPEHVRSLTSPRVLEVEADLITRLARRGQREPRPMRLMDHSGERRRAVAGLDRAQARVAATLAGTGGLIVVEGAAGAGKTTILKAAQQLLAQDRHRMLVVTPTLKAAQVAAEETGADGHSAAWLIHQHGWRWDTDGRWSRLPDNSPDRSPTESAQLKWGDLLLVDEAGMLDQDTAQALLTIADESGARVAFVGDRHQLPAVGRGGVLDHAHHWAHPSAVLTLETVHRFTDPDYAALTLKMRTGDDPAAVFDQLHRRGQIVLHHSDVERTAALAKIGATGELVLAERRDLVADLNATIRDQLGTRDRDDDERVLTIVAGERLGVGDRVATRRNDRDLQVANRQTWTIQAIHDDGSMTLRSHGRDRQVPAGYAAQYVELAYASTIHGAQGDTVPHAHLALDDTSGAAGIYVAMTRGRHTNTAHLVANNLDQARQQWVAAFSRDRADLGPAHARTLAADAIDRYGPNAPRRRPLPPPPPSRTIRDERGISL